jgi:ATP-dependent DNA helicase RecG
MLELSSKVQFVKGVGPRKAEALAAVGITTVSDLLVYLPFRYEDRSRRRPIRDLRAGEDATVLAKVLGVRVKRTRRPRFKVLEAVVEDDTGPIRAIWFNQEFLKDILQVGRQVLLYGKVEPSRRGGGLELKNPQYELVEDGDFEPTHTGRVVPVYERVGPISPRMLRRICHSLVENLPSELPELLPESVRDRYRFPSRREALARAHFPEEGASLGLYNEFRSPAQQRLIFEEFFSFSLGLALRRRAVTHLAKPRAFRVDDRIREKVRQILPFRLTEAQKKVSKTLADELSSGRSMQRLLQGDVGSGKTIVAVVASVIVIENGAQVALMVPTEVLAEQHFGNVRRILSRAGYRIALLTSALSRAERDELLASIARGEVHLVVGTHALIQQGVRFKELGLAIIDEQHRFGVLQRAELRAKGYAPDLLVMTATPIPRSLAMALYGDLDHSVLDELPPDRPPVRTLLMKVGQREELHRLMEEQVAAGHQVYFICPVVEESERMDLKAAVETHRLLQKGPFSHRRVALVHGRMGSAEREEAMSAFASGDVDILVATTVVEVGVDVPNATLMVVEQAERFGLSQLHQLRGRVGRGKAPSTAVLVYHPPLTPEAERRLEAMAETNDGFVIAERDLDIRGPGDYFGTRQWGAPLFRVADVVRDRKLLELARREAEDLLSSPETTERDRIVDHVIQTWGRRFGLATAG